MFIFSGSKRRLMSNMFNTSSKPFYQSALCMGLDPIPVSVYADFACGLFKEFDKRIEISVIEEVYRMCGFKL